MSRVPNNEPNVVRFGKFHSGENVVRGGDVDGICDVSPKRTFEVSLEGITTAIGERCSHHRGGVGFTKRSNCEY